MSSLRLIFLSSIAFAAALHSMPAAPPKLASGAAEGHFARKGENEVALTHAAAFVDQKDERKPMILILSDKKLPTEGWTSEFDLMFAKSEVKFSGVVFWIDKDGSVFRSDDYWQGRQESTSGIFELKLDPKDGKELTGAAGARNSPDNPKLTVTFHATLK